jgi:signal transduction histidine kinase
MSDPILIGRGQLGRGLSLFGAAVLSWSIVTEFVHGNVALWVLVGALAANVAWVVLVMLGSQARAVPIFCIAVMVLGGGLAAAALDGSALVPAAVAVLWLTRDIRFPSWRGLILGVATMALVVVGDVLVPISLLGLIALEAGIVVGFLAGLSRRQFAIAEIRSRELVEEHARADVLAARAHLASEIHDVLAHSLGGLVIQLDAVDALLESGDAAAAAAKVRDARTLAAEGLSEARRAVLALSEPPTDASVRVAADQVVADVAALVTAHDSLGGTSGLRQVGTGRAVSKPVELALRRAVQEGLTNARKHAPGARVDVVLTWADNSVQLEISNPLGVTNALSITNPLGMSAGSPSGGHGLVGMRERFAALPGGSASAGSSGGRFVVTVKAATP